jgi:hypothetical protein
MLPAADLLEMIEEADLDFVALTDHSEADVLLPEGEGGPEYPVWDGQAQSVLDAQASGRLVLLGYEWSGFRNSLDQGHARGSHRTVLLSDPTACEAYRVPGWELAGGESVQELGTAIYRQDRLDEVVATPEELWERLDMAREDCAPVTWLSFAHHPAYEIPQQTDWWAEENAPRRENVVEIYSEHGSSECSDLDEEGCDWRINEGNGYVEAGSVQAALDRGFKLGFLGGSDSHDARPGSIWDGAGPVGHWEDSDGDGEVDQPIRQFTSGGLSGVWLRGELTAETLLDAIESRQTLASSGIRPELKLNARGRYGESFVMGDVVPASALPLTLSAWTALPDWEGQIIYERIGPGGEVEDRQEGEQYTGIWEPSETSWTYLRIRYVSPDGSEERIWISPWFTTGPESRDCGCSQAKRPLEPLSLLLIVAIGLGFRSRRGRCPLRCVDSAKGI